MTENPTPDSIVIQLDTVTDCLTQTTRALARLNGLDVLDADSTQTKKAKVAEITRDLLFLADTLQLASSLVRNEYWAVKGYDSTVQLASNVPPVQ